MLKRILPWIILASLLVACGGPSAPKSEITLVMTDFAYTPTAFVIPVGQPVRITLENKGLVEHDFVIESVKASVALLQDGGAESHQMHGQEHEFDVHVSAQKGESTALELTVSEPGTYEIFCSVEGHKEAGMIGELIVVED